jgi:branched-chain amino acid transport system permease protein
MRRPEVWALIAPGVVLLLLALFPILFPAELAWLGLGFLTFIFVTLAVAWNLVGGYAGQISFGYAAFFGTGAYVTAILWSRNHWDPVATLPVAGLGAVLVALVVGLPCFRLVGPYFSIATIGMSEASRVLALNLDQITGGASGLNLPLDVPSKSWFYWSGLALAAVTVALSAWVRASRLGLGLFALRMDQDAAESLGLNTPLFKNLVHCLSAFLVGVAAGLYVVYFSYVHPNQVFSFDLSIGVVLMGVIGGVGTLWGPVLGAAIYYPVRQLLLSQSSLVAFNLLVYGGLLIAIVLFEPGGLLGLVRRFTHVRSRSPKPASFTQNVPSQASTDARLGGSAGPAILEIASVTRRFGGLIAVRDVSLSVQLGEILGLVGPNGAGKTTLFRCLVGALRPNGGAVRLDGQRIDGLNQYQLVRRGVCHTHQIPAPFGDLSVRDNVRVGASFGRQARRAHEVVDAVLDRTGLRALADVPAANLGVGNLKLLEVARALATGPRLLCLDEVGGGLTPVELDRMLALIQSVRADGVTVLYIEHNMRAIRAICDRVVVLDFGQRIAEGTPDEVAHDPLVIEAYLGEGVGQVLKAT